MVNLLALDTSTDRAAMGAATRCEAVFSESPATNGRHGRDLIPRLKATLDAAGLTAREVELLAVGLGPGSYTGLRVGLMAAKTLAYASGAALVGLDSLEVIAWGAPPHCGPISVIADAQRGNLYIAEYVRDATGPPRCTRNTQVEPILHWLGRLEPATLVLGPALESPRIRALLPSSLQTAVPALNYPQGQLLIELAHAVWASGRRDDPALVEPRYLRESSAEHQWVAHQQENARANRQPPTVPD
jgi:tRNA threonylcarbamoyladenosine biosynthesis protein TsaB